MICGAIRTVGMRIIRKVAAYILLVSVYGFTWLAVVLGRIIPHRPWKPTGRIVVTGTFFNLNWYLSHITPLSCSGVQEVILVVDEPQLPLKRVRFVCPPKWLAKLISRAGAKAIWIFLAGIRYRPDLYMGYHIAPGACSALVAGKLLGRPSCYQMTGGPVEVIGGGFRAGQSIGRFLGRPSEFIERMAMGIIRQFELVVVRGNRSKKFLAAREIHQSVAIITGSVNGCLRSPRLNRGIHLVFVGRLDPGKQVHQFIAIVDSIRSIIPNVHAAIVGDGVLMADLKDQAQKSGVAENVEFLGRKKDVEAILTQSKVFVLTSKSEGLSIAMAEAMAAGVVPVVADVGELGDLVIDGMNGYLVEPNNIAEYSRRIISLLQDRTMWDKFSCMAVEEAKKHCDIEVVTLKWRRLLRQCVESASGFSMQEMVE